MPECLEDWVDEDIPVRVIDAFDRSEIGLAASSQRRRDGRAITRLYF